MAEPLTGRLLVATPALDDPNFRRTVVLLVEHGAEGALGVVLNRPTDAAYVAPLAAWEALASEPSVLFVGGPVQQDAVFSLARFDAASEAVTPLLGPVGVLDLDATDRTGVTAVRMFVGYAGWGPGQLEMELAEGAWFLVDAEPDDLLTASPDALWHEVLARQPDGLRLLATFPEDPSMN